MTYDDTPSPTISGFVTCISKNEELSSVLFCFVGCLDSNGCSGGLTASTFNIFAFVFFISGIFSSSLSSDKETATN